MFLFFFVFVCLFGLFIERNEKEQESQPWASNFGWEGACEVSIIGNITLLTVRIKSFREEKRREEKRREEKRREEKRREEKRREEKRKKNNRQLC